MATTTKVGRLFFAVPLSEEVRKGLKDFIDKALKGKPIPGRAPNAENWHLTLRFLGEVDEVEYQSLLSAMKTEELGAPFETVFQGLGAFPRPSKAAVLWVGVGQGHQELCYLAECVDRAAKHAGLPPEDKLYSPHLTLSRIRPPQRLDTLIQNAGISNLRYEVDRVVLFRSHLGPSGARYELLKEYVLTRSRV